MKMYDSPIRASQRDPNYETFLAQSNLAQVYNLDSKLTQDQESGLEIQTSQRHCLEYCQTH